MIVRLAHMCRVLPGTAVLVLSLCSGAAASFVPLERDSKAGGVGVDRAPRRVLDCSGAIALQIGDTVEGSTIGLTSNVDAYGCSEWAETGGEVVYALSVPEPAMFEIRLFADCDLDVAILSSCDAGGGCLLVADAGIRTTTPMSGDFFVVVDGYEGAECAFTLEVVSSGPSGVDPVACESAEPLSCATLVGDTCDGEDHVRALGCEAFPANGREDWYRLTLAPGGEISAEIAMAENDVVLWILGGCAESAECLAHADDTGTGEPESVGWVNDGLEDRTVFLVVDSYAPKSCGAYAGTVFCDGIRVPNDFTSWSALKDRFTGEEK